MPAGPEGVAASRRTCCSPAPSRLGQRPTHLPGVRTLAAALVQCMRDSQHITIAAFCYIQTGVREAEVYQDRVI